MEHIPNNIVIAFPVVASEKWVNNQMISRKVNNSNFIEGISKFAKCLEVTIEQLLQNNESMPRFDYIWVDFTDLKALLFILREQGIISLPFLIKLPVVYGDLIVITKIIPFLKEEDIIFGPSFFAKKCFMKVSQSFDIKVISNTIDVQKIQNTILNKKSINKKTITFLGRLVPDKGIGDLIDCLPQIISCHKDAELRIIGPFSGDLDNEGVTTDYYHELLKQIEKLKIQDHIVWCGPLYGDFKYKMLAESDILINPSVFKGETFGVINIEALACGVPVICSNWSGFSEIIEHGYNGYLVDVHEKQNDKFNFEIDKEKLIEYVNILLGDDELLTNMKLNSKQSAINYDHYKIHKELFKILKPKQYIKGNWDKVKNMSFADFKSLYTEAFYQIISIYNFDKLHLRNIIENIAIEDNEILLRTFLDLLASYQLNDKKTFSKLPENHLYNLIYLNEYLNADSFLSRITDEDKKNLFEYIIN